jgi:hypothetical protein
LNNAESLILNQNIRINWYLCIKNINVNPQIIFQ